MALNSGRLSSVNLGEFLNISEVLFPSLPNVDNIPEFLKKA